MLGKVILAKTVAIMSLTRHTGFVGSVDLCLNTGWILNWGRKGGGTFNGAQVFKICSLKLY